VTGGGHGDRDRIGHRPGPDGGEPIERRARPGGARRLDEGAALAGRLQVALLRGAQRRGELGGFAQQEVVAGRGQPAAALVVQILMAAERSFQPPAVSTQQQSSVQSVEGDSGESPKLPELRKAEPLAYGAPLTIAAMAHAPTNETGVVFLFGALAAGLGFRVEHLQMAFPDCEAKREVVPGKWERVRIEFEFESRNFKEHRHDPDSCDVIVCWRHNWPDCPERLEVVELARVVG